MFTTVAGLRVDYARAIAALNRLLAMLRDAEVCLQRLIRMAREAMRAAMDRIRAAQAAIAEAQAAMDAAADADDDDAYACAADELAAAHAELAAAEADYEQARIVWEQASQQLVLVRRAIALTVEARSAVTIALAGLGRHRAVEEAVGGHPGVADRTDAYAPLGGSP